MKFLQDKSYQWLLFPNKRIDCDSGMVVYRLIKEIFQKIVQDSLCVAASVDVQNECKSLAFGVGRLVHKGYQYTVHYDGSDAVDVLNVIEHARVHLPIAVKHCTKKTLVFRIVVSNTVPVQKVQTRLGIPKGHAKTNDNIIPLFIYEKRNSPRNPGFEKITECGYDLHIVIMKTSNTNH